MFDVKDATQTTIDVYRSTGTLGFMTEIVRYRCAACGNKTRFDVVDSVTRRRFHHYSLGGELTVEDEDIIERNIVRVVCRWCDRSDAIEELHG